MKFVRPTLVTAAAALLLAGPLALVQASAAEQCLPDDPTGLFCIPGEGSEQGQPPAPSESEAPASDSSDSELEDGTSTFDPSTFDPSTFDPSTFDPSTFDPSTFGGSPSGGSTNVAAAEEPPADEQLKPLTDILCQVVSAIKEGGGQQLVDGLKPLAEEFRENGAENIADALEGNCDGDGDGGGLEDLDDALKPVTDILCEVVATIAEGGGQQLVDALEPLAQQFEDNGAENLANALRGICGEQRQPSNGDDEQPRPPVEGGTLPKTGGVPMWLIPTGLLLVTVGSLMVMPAPVRSEI